MGAAAAVCTIARRILQLGRKLAVNCSCCCGSKQLDSTFVPLQEVDHLGRVPSSQQQQRQLLVSGSFVPPGRSSSPVAALRAQSGELLLQLERQLARDWPKSFMKVCGVRLWRTVAYCGMCGAK